MVVADQAEQVLALAGFEVRQQQAQHMESAAQQGSAWYALGTEECVLQKFKEPPPLIPPGRLVGSFEKLADGKLVFTPVRP